MANIATTEKLYLDATGLKALIDKIGEFYKEYKDHVSEENSSLEEIVARLDELYVAGDGDVDATGLVKDLQDAVKALQDSLGNADDVAGDTTAYARIKQLEDEVQTATTGLLDRTTKLESESYADVEGEWNSDSKTIDLTFKNAAGVDLKTININAADFVIDGMVKNVHLVTIKNDGTVDWPEGDTHEVPGDIAQMHGKKYLVICFNVANHVDDGTAVNDVWVPVDELFNDYDFKAVATDDTYVTLSVEEVNPDTSNNVNNVTYTIALGDAAKKDFQLVEGTYQRTGESVIETIRGIEKLHDDLKAAEAEIDKLQSEVEGPDTGVIDRVTKLEEDYATDITAADTGLLDRTAAIENWIETDGAIPVSNIQNVFDYYVFGKTEGVVTPPSLTDANA